MPTAFKSFSKIKAISNAISNGIGQRIKTMPFTKDNITKELLN